MNILKYKKNIRNLYDTIIGQLKNLSLKIFSPKCSKYHRTNLKLAFDKKKGHSFMT